MAERDLDAEFPTGDPTSRLCRYDNTVKVRSGPGLLCEECDAKALVIARANRRTPPRLA